MSVSAHYALQSVSRGRTDNARVFRAALRHSRFVRRLRVAIPVVVVLGVVATVLSAYVLNPWRMAYSTLCSQLTV